MGSWAPRHQHLVRAFLLLPQWSEGRGPKAEEGPCVLTEQSSESKSNSWRQSPHEVIPSQKATLFLAPTWGISFNMNFGGSTFKEWQYLEYVLLISVELQALFQNFPWRSGEHLLCQESDSRWQMYKIFHCSSRLLCFQTPCCLWNKMISHMVDFFFIDTPLPDTNIWVSVVILGCSGRGLTLECVNSVQVSRRNSQVCAGLRGTCALVTGTEAWPHTALPSPLCAC